jgi:hypothetical protein
MIERVDQRFERIGSLEVYVISSAPQFPHQQQRIGFGVLDDQDA